MPTTDAIYDRAASLWVTARRQGLPTRDADLIIASTALEDGRSLATGNTDHFSWIGGLRLENWRD
jgi:predicted nucleic acid-binding protein